jgi:hypothetical protein
VQLDNGRTAFIDKTGKPVATLDGNVWADPFSDGLAKVKFTDAQRTETIGYVDSSGKIAIPPRFVGGTSFVNGSRWSMNAAPAATSTPRGTQCGAWRSARGRTRHRRRRATSTPTPSRTPAVTPDR